jgi:hypothetical protein
MLMWSGPNGFQPAAPAADGRASRSSSESTDLTAPAKLFIVRTSQRTKRIL